jgi:GTPase
MFVDEITIEAKAGRGGDGVVRWRQEKFVDKGGPWGGNGGRGGDIYMRAVRDVALLARYTGEKSFSAQKGTSGATKSKQGIHGEDLYIDVPVGSRVTDTERNRVYHFMKEGETIRILKGGSGGLGNEHFKSSTNRSPETATKGRAGESGVFYIELLLAVDVGIIGFPNAGKSTLLNALTHAHSRVGAYPFTTTEPHLGDLFGYILADIPGLIEGASLGKGLGHKFLRHVERTKMLLHCISLEEEDILKSYNSIRNELTAFDEALGLKQEIVVLTKSDLVDVVRREGAQEIFTKNNIKTIIVSAEDGDGLKELTKTLTDTLKTLEINSVD